MGQTKGKQKLDKERYAGKKERDEAIKVLSELGWIQVAKWKNRRIILLHPSISKK